MHHFKNYDGTWSVSNKYSWLLILSLPEDANTTSCLNDPAGCVGVKKKYPSTPLKLTRATLNVVFRNKKMWEKH